MSSITVTIAAKKLGISTRRMRMLCEQRRVPGARFVGMIWMIPENFVVTDGTRGPALGSVRVKKPKA